MLLHIGKGNFTDETKLRVLRWGDYSNYLGGPNIIRGPCKREAGGSESERETGRGYSLALTMEDRATG